MDLTYKVVKELGKLCIFIDEYYTYILPPFLFVVFVVSFSSHNCFDSVELIVDGKQLLLIISQFLSQVKLIFVFLI